jgi:D-alanyl-D-alanine carboxypeptidase/D-alanyl-D-alanine-endopeptidase (penicillin-binding protein 4)
MKLVTTLAGLEVLGPTYLWHTDVYLLGTITEGVLHGDLLLKGRGDPYLVIEDFWQLLRALRRQGLRRIEGELLIDNTYFAQTNHDPAAFDGQASRAYNVGPDALLVNFQAFRFEFVPNANGLTVQVDPELPNLRITNRLTLGSGSCTAYQRGIQFDLTGSADQVNLSGSYPRHCGAYSMLRTALDPARYTYGLFSALWRELGGEITGGVRLAIAPQGVVPFLVWSSPPLAEVIRALNKQSNNVMARQLLLTLAAERVGTPATVADGQGVVLDYLRQIGIDTTGIEIGNGAGLARETRISPAQLVAMLRHAASLPTMPEYVASLSLSGLDGTMRNRLDGTAVAGRMHMKTGSLDGTAAIAGYVDAQSGRRYVLAGILNHPGADDGIGEQLLNALLEWTFRQ